jgi:hypothetical protein
LLLLSLLLLFFVVVCCCCLLFVVVVRRRDDSPLGGRSPHPAIRWSLGASCCGATLHLSGIAAAFRQ